MWNPEQYHRFRNERSAPFFDLIDLLRGEGFSRAVDLGCGTGELTRAFHERFGVGSTVGMDSSASMLNRARTQAGSGLSFKQESIERFSGTEEYDVILSNAALQWCDDHPRILSRMHAALKPEGQLLVQVPANQDYPTHRIARQLGSELPFQPNLPHPGTGHSVLTPEAYSTLLHDLGFREQHVRLQVYTHLLESREAVIEWVKGTLLTHYESNLPPELFARFMDEFRKRLFAELPDQKPFFYPFKRILFWAKK